MVNRGLYLMNWREFTKLPITGSTISLDYWLKSWITDSKFNYVVEWPRNSSNLVSSIIIETIINIIIITIISIITIIRIITIVIVITIIIIIFIIIIYSIVALLFQVPCGIAPLPGNGSVELRVSGSTYTAEMRCNPGFRLLGRSRIICQEDSTWQFSM